MSFINPDDYGISFSKLSPKGSPKFLSAGKKIATQVDPCLGFSVSIERVSTNSDGSPSEVIQSNINGGTAPFAYLWSDGSTNPTIVDPGSGDYSLTVTDSNGCSASSLSVNIEERQVDYADCVSSYLPIDSEGRIYAIQLFESVRQDLGNPIKMVGGPNAEGVGQTNVNYFGNEEFGGGIPFGADDNRVVKDTSPIVSYNGTVGSIQEVRTYYVLLKDDNVPGAQNAPYSEYRAVNIATGEKTDPTWNPPNGNYNWGNGLELRNNKYYWQGETLFPGGGGHDVGIPQTYKFQSEQFHRSYAGNPTNIWASYSVERGNPGLNGMLVPPGWRVVIYVDTNYLGWLCEGNVGPVLGVWDGPVYFHEEASLPIDFDFSNADCPFWSLFKNVKNVPISDRIISNMGNMNYWHKRCAWYSNGNGGYSYSFSKIPIS